MKKKNYIVAFSKSTYKAGGLDVYLNNLYKLFPNEEFIELSNLPSTNFIIKRKKYVEEKEHKNVTYICENSKKTLFKYGHKNARKILKTVVNSRIIINDISFFQMVNYNVCKKNECYLIDHGGGHWASLEMSSKLWMRTFSKIMLWYKYLRHHNQLKNINLITFTKYDVIQIKKYFKFKSYNTIPVFFEFPEIKNEIFSFSEDQWKYKSDLVFMGRFARQKGIKTLNSIAKKTNSSFNVAGAGSKEKDFKWKLVNKFGFIKSVEEKKKHLASAKYYLSTSIYEGFSFAIVESLRFGTPVIALNTFPSLKFIIGENNERGYLFDTKKEIIEFLKNKEKIDYSTWKKQSLNAQFFIMNEINIKNFVNSWTKIFNNDILLK